MKRLAITVLTTLLLMGLSAFAQEAQPTQGEQRQRRGGSLGFAQPPERAARLARELGLSDEQKARVQKIYEDAGKDAQPGASPQERIARTNEKVRTVLTDDQKKKFDEMNQRRQGGTGGGGQKSPSF